MIAIVSFFLCLLYVFVRLFLRRRSDSVGCLVGKTAIVTGGNSGLGLATCQLLASRGCRVIIADCVNAEKTAEDVKKKTGNPNISYRFLDLSSFRKVREFVEEIEKTESKIDILINNAGVGLHSKILTEDGLNSVTQINFFGSFLLTHLMLKLLRASEDARVVFTGSIMIFLFNLDLEEWNSMISDDFMITNSKIYSNSKFLNVFAAQEFAKRVQSSHITFNSIDPHCVKSYNFYGNVEKITPWKFFGVVFKLLILFLGDDPIVCAQSTLEICTNEEFKRKTGGHYSCVLPWFKPRQLKDGIFCEKVWKRCEELVKLRPEEKIVQ